MPHDVTAMGCESASYPEHRRFQPLHGRLSCSKQEINGLLNGLLNRHIHQCSHIQR